jgi:hypothetical protein
MVVQTKIVFLPVQLTEDELRAKGRQQASAMIEYTALEGEKRELVAELGTRLKSKRKELDRLAVEVRTGLESRPVECELVPIWGSHTVVTVRRDTGEQIDTRQMTAPERQLELRAVSGEPDEDESEPLDDAEDEDDAEGGDAPH